MPRRPDDRRHLTVAPPILAPYSAPMQLGDEAIWCLPGALMDPPNRAAETFAATPIIELLQSAAARWAGTPAVVGLTASLDAAELFRLARNVAGAVAALVPAGQPVACLLPYSPKGTAGLLGCLLSGRLCMVLDPTYPAERQAALLANTRPAGLLLADPPQFAPPSPVLMLTDAMAGPDRDWPPAQPWDPDAPFVVYFTSGSSGTPKGIVLSARYVLFRAWDVADRWSLHEGDAAYSAAGHGLFTLCALLCSLERGARVLQASLGADGATSVLWLLEREAVTCADIQAPILRLLLQMERGPLAFRTLRSLRIGSAALARIDLAAWRLRLPAGCTILHSYASTEAQTLAIWAVPPDDDGPEPTVASGRLQAHHDYALLDEDGRRVRPGEPGELVLRSRYVALGEWQDGRLVPGRMPPVPGRPGWRFFRTGDLLRLQPDGLLRVVGRADRQVKINGVRIEPAEIEMVLRAEPGVTDAAVLSGMQAGRATLFGFVASTAADQPALVAALRRRAATALPPAMRPARLIVMNRLPTLPNGKVDMVRLLAAVEG